MNTQQKSDPADPKPLDPLSGSTRTNSFGGWATYVVGMASGVGFAVLLYLALSLDLSRQLLGFLLAVGCASLILLLGVNWWQRNTRRKIQEAVQNFPTQMEAFGQKVMRLPQLTDAERREVAANLVGVAKLILSAAVGAWSLFRAFTFLAAILTASISIAVFVATYMQVERLDVQNQLAESGRRSALILELTVLKECRERGGRRVQGVDSGRIEDVF